MTDEMWNSLPQTEKQRLQDEAADLIKSANTSNTNAGEDPKPFKLTDDERLKIMALISDLVSYQTPTIEQGKKCVNDIEAIINEGWQTCD